MRASLFLAAFDPMHEVPAACGLCRDKPPVFSYELRTYGANLEVRDAEGFCCAACAFELVKKLERDESREWAKEEAALKVEDFDVANLRARRAAAFPNAN